MKLVRYGKAGSERPGLLIPDSAGGAMILDVRAQAFDIEDFDGFFFARGGPARVAALAREQKRKLIPAASVRLGPPVPVPGKIIAVGKNYADHAKEFDSAIPKQPIFFAKSPGSWTGPHDPIVLPPGAVEGDAEAELGLVIGRRATRVTEETALSFVAGYLVVNDMTDRVAQRAAGQWFQGKSADTFCPAGPWLVTPDEISDAQNLRLWSRLNGKAMQDGNTRDMLFPIARLIAILSQTITLEPGDVISTGTPSGVGMARTPPVYLKPGDVVEVGVDNIGSLRNPVVSGK